MLYIPFLEILDASRSCVTIVSCVVSAEAIDAAQRNKITT